MSNIVAFAGLQRSGKTSSTEYIFGCKMLEKELIKRFDIGDNGELLVNATFYDNNGNPYEEMAQFSIDNPDPGFKDYCEARLYSYIKNYNFADILKSIAIELYGLTHEQAYGTTEQKQSDTKYKWDTFYETIPKRYKPKRVDMDSFMSVRQFLQYTADILCSINEECFVTPTLRMICQEQSALSLIGDVRKEIEIDRVHEVGGKVILLTRKTTEDTHRTEKELETVSRDKFDAVIDNQNMTITERNRELYNIMNSWGLIR